MERNQFNLLFGEKGGAVCSRFFSFHHRFPKLSPNGLLKEIGIFLSHCTQAFLENHDTFILSRILLSHYRFLSKKDIRKRIDLKILKISPSVYGIAIALFCEQESFNESHIFKRVQNLIPGLKEVPQSYFAFTRDHVHFYYFEIKKMRGGVFSLEEKEKLSSELSSHLLKGLEHTSATFFFPGNEEELFKNIRHLSQELKFVDDLPQVMISIVEYLEDTLKFLVIVLRVVKPTTPSIISLSSQLSSLVRFSLENVFCLGQLRKKYPKEATLFTLEVANSLFLRNNQSINLRMARQYIVRVLETMLGPFRDYNGGLLNKENEQLHAIKRHLEKERISFSFPLLEDFFYGIKPIGMRALVSEEIGKEFVSLFQKVVETPLEYTQTHCLDVHASKEVLLLIVKTRQKEWKNSLPKRILSAFSRIGYSYLEYEGIFYLCFFKQYPENTHLFDLIQKELAQSASLISEQQSLLRINFQGGDPPSLNPRLANDIQCHILSNLLFEGLTQVSLKGEIVPAIAEKIEISASRLHYTFHLRPTWWSNGEEVTAYHFEKTWKKALLAGRRMYMNFFSPIKNALKASNQGISLEQVGVTSKDAKTLCVELESPCPHFLNLVASPPFFPLLGDSEEPTDFNGPFEVADWKRDSGLYLSKNPFYWDARRVQLGGIKISMIRDPYVSYRLFQEGELDFIGDPINPLPVEVLKDPKIQDQLHYKQVSRVFWVHCNTHDFPLHNAYLRRALSLALNRELLTEHVFIQQIPQVSPLPPKYASLKGHTKGNLKLAQKYFNRAIEELKIEKDQFPPLVFTHSDLSFETGLACELKKQWENAFGITIHLKGLSWSEFSAALERRDFQLGGLFRRDFYNNCMFYLNFFKTSSHNPHGWENKKYERLLEQCFKEGPRPETVKKMEYLLIEQSPVIPLINQRYLVLMNKRLKGVEWNENGCLDLKEAKINEDNN